MIKRIIDKLAASRVVWIICALVAAVILWKYVAKDQEITRRVSVIFDITYENEITLDNNSLELASDTPNQVSLMVEGTYSDVNKIQEKPVIVIDLASVNRQGEYKLNFQVKTSPSTSTWSVATSAGETYLTLSAIKVAQANVAVRLDNQIKYSVAQGYSVDADEITINPSTINISGPEDIVNQIEYARVRSYTSTGEKSKTFEETVPIEFVIGGGTNGEEAEVLSDTDAAKLTADATTVKVTIPITVTWEAKLTVNVKYTGSGLSEENVEITLSKETVTLSGPVEARESIGDTLSIGDIDLRDAKYAKYSETVGEVVENDLSVQTTFTVPYPSDVTSEGTKEVTATVKISGVSTKTITATHISAANVPTGYKAEVQTSEVALVVRAPSDVINQIGESNIRVVADLSGVDVSGSSLSLTPTIYIDGFSTAGTLNLENNKIRVTVTQTG